MQIYRVACHSRIAATGATSITMFSSRLSRIVSASTTSLTTTPARATFPGTREAIARLETLITDQFRATFAQLEGAFARRFEQLFDGVTGWSINSMQGDQQLSGDQLESAKNGYFPSPLLDYAAHGASIALEPKAQVNGRDAYVIRLTPKTGQPSKLFFDAETFMLVRTTGKVNNPQLGEVESVSEPSDYRDVNGVKVAFTMYQSAGGQNITMKFAKIENNVPVDDSVFVKK